LINRASDSDRAFGQIIVQLPWRDVLRCEYVDCDRAHGRGDAVKTVATFSSLPPSEQFDAWHQAVSKAFVPLDARSRTEGAFGGVLANRAVGAVQFSDVSGGAVDVYRSAQAIRRFDPGYLKLGMQLRGYCLVTQDGREAPLTPGDFALYDTRRPYQLSFDSEFRMLVVMFPRELLNLRADDLANVVARRVSGRRGVGGLVSPFLVKLANELRSDQIVPTFELSNAVLDLFAAALSEQLGCESSVRPETRRHALILQIKAFIDARLDDPELTTATIAAAHYISPRYLQKLFEAEGSTVTDWIRRRRLDHCRRELLDPRNAGEPISRIAARWGLLDSSHFSRLFRATYGMSPREFRSERIVSA